MNQFTDDQPEETFALDAKKDLATWEQTSGTEDEKQQAVWDARDARVEATPPDGEETTFDPNFEIGAAKAANAQKAEQTAEDLALYGEPNKPASQFDTFAKKIQGAQSESHIGTMVSDEDLADETVQKSLSKLWGLGQDTTGEELKDIRDKFAQSYRDTEQVKIATGDTDVKRGWFSNAASSVVKGFAGSFIHPIAGIARTVGADTIADHVAENENVWEYMAPTDKEFDASLTGQYMRGMGQMVGSVSQFVAGGGIAKGINLARAGYLAKYGADAAAIAKFGTVVSAGKAAASLAKTERTIATGFQYAMNYGAEFSDAYNSAIEMGMTPGEAYVKSMGYAVTAAGTETLSDLTLFGKLGKGAALRNQLARINSTAARTATGAGVGFVAGMPIEGVTEGAQRTLQNLALGKDDVWEGVWEEARVGALVGGTVKSVSGGIAALKIDPKVAPALAESVRKLQGDTTQAINPDESERAPGFAPGTMPDEFEDMLTTPDSMEKLREAVTNGATVSIDGKEIGLAVGETLYTPGPDAGPTLADDAEPIPGLESARLVFKEGMTDVINSGITTKKVNIVPGQAQVEQVGKAALAEISKVESDDNLTDAQKEDAVLRIADSINARAAVDGRYAPLFKVAQGAINARMFKAMASETQEVTGFTTPRVSNLTNPVAVKGMTTEAIEKNSARVTVNNVQARLDPTKKGLMINDKVVTWDELAKPENVVKVSNPITKQVTKPGVELLNTEGTTLNDSPFVKIAHARRDGKTVVANLADGTTHVLDFKGGQLVSTEGRVITRDELKASKTFIGDSKSYKQQVMPTGTDKTMFESARLVTKLEEINYQSPKRAMEILAARGDQNSPLAQLLMNSPGIENVRVRVGRFAPDMVDGKPQTFAGRYDSASNTIDLNLDARNSYADNGGRYDILGTYLHEVGHAVLKSRVNNSQTMSAQDKVLFDTLEEGRLAFMEATKDSTNAGVKQLRSNFEGQDGLDEFMVELGRSPEVQKVLTALDSRGMVDGKKPNLFRRIMNAILNAISQQDINPHSQFAKSWRALYDLNSQQNAKPAEVKPNADRKTLYAKGFTIGDYLGMGDSQDDVQSVEIGGVEDSYKAETGDEGDAEVGINGATVDAQWMNTVEGAAAPIKAAKDYESKLTNAIEDAWSRIQDPAGWAAKQADVAAAKEAGVDISSPTEINAIMQSVYDSQITRATQGLVKRLADKGVPATEQRAAVNYALRVKPTDNAATRNAKARSLEPIIKSINEADRLGVFVRKDLKGFGLKPAVEDQFFNNIQGLRGAAAARNSAKIKLANLDMAKMSQRILAKDLKAKIAMDTRAIREFSTKLDDLVGKTGVNPQDIADVISLSTRYSPLTEASQIMADSIDTVIKDTEKSYPVSMEIKPTPPLPSMDSAEFEQLAQEVGKIMDGTDWNSNRLQAEMNNPAMLIRNAYPQQITEMFDLLLPEESIKGELAVQGAVKLGEDMKFGGAVTYLRNAFKKHLDLKKIPVTGNLKAQYDALVAAYGSKQKADRSLFVGKGGKFSNISRHVDKVMLWESDPQRFANEIASNNARYKFAARKHKSAGGATVPMAFDGLNQLRMGADMASQVIREHHDKVKGLLAEGVSIKDIVPEQKVLDAQEDIERLDSYRQRHLDVLLKYNGQLDEFTHAILQSTSPLDLVRAVEGYATGDNLEGNLGRSQDSLPGVFDRLKLLEAQQELMDAAESFINPTQDRLQAAAKDYAEFRGRLVSSLGDREGSTKGPTMPTSSPDDLLNAVRNYVEFRNSNKRPVDFTPRKIDATPYKAPATTVTYGAVDYTDENYVEEVKNFVGMIPTIRKASIPVALKTLRNLITPGIMDKHAAPRDLWRKLGGGKEQLPITELPRGVVQEWLEGRLKGRSMDKYLYDAIGYMKDGQLPLEIANVLTAERHLIGQTNVTDSGLSLRLQPVMKDVASFQSEFRGVPSRKLMSDRQKARDKEVTSAVKDAVRTEVLSIQAAMKATALELTKVPEGARRDQLREHNKGLTDTVTALNGLISEEPNDRTSAYFFEEAQSILEKLDPNATKTLVRHVKEHNILAAELIESADRLIDSLPPGVITSHMKGVQNVLDMMIFDPKKIQNQPHAIAHEMIRNTKVRLAEARAMLVTLRDASAIMVPQKDRTSGPVVKDGIKEDGTPGLVYTEGDRDKLTYPENNRFKANRDLRNAVNILETNPDVIAYKKGGGPEPIMVGAPTEKLKAAKELVASISKKIESAKVIAGGVEPRTDTGARRKMTDTDKQVSEVESNLKAMETELVTAEAEVEAAQREIREYLATNNTFTKSEELSPNVVEWLRLSKELANVGRVNKRTPFAHKLSFEDLQDQASVPNPSFIDGNISPVWDQHTRAVYNHYWDVMHAGMQAQLDAGGNLPDVLVTTVPDTRLVLTQGASKRESFNRRIAIDPREELRSFTAANKDDPKGVPFSKVKEIREAVKTMVDVITPKLDMRLQNFAKRVQYGKFTERFNPEAQETTEMFDNRAVSLGSVNTPTAKWAGILEFGVEQDNSPFEKYIEATPEAAQTVGARGVAARIPDSDLEDMSARDSTFVEGAMDESNYGTGSEPTRLNQILDNNSSGEGRVLYSRAFVDTIRGQIAPSEDGAWRKFRRNTMGKARAAGGQAMRAFESFSQLKASLKQEDQRNIKAVEDYLKKHGGLRGRVDQYLGTFNMSFSATESARVDDIYWGIENVMVDEVQDDGSVKSVLGPKGDLKFAQNEVIRAKVAHFQAERAKAIHEVSTAHPGLAKVLDRMRNNLERMSDIKSEDVFSYDRMSFSISPEGALMSSRPSYRMKGTAKLRTGGESPNPIIYQSMGRLATAVQQDRVDEYLDGNPTIEQFKDALFDLHMAPEIAELLRNPKNAGWSLSEKRNGIRIKREESLSKGIREQIYENFKANVKNKESSTMFSGIGDSIDTAHLPKAIRDVISGEQGGGSFFSYATSQAGERAAKAALATALSAPDVALVQPTSKAGFRRIPPELGIEGYASPDTIAALHEALDFTKSGFFAKVFNKLIGLSHTMLTAGNFIAGPLRQGLGGLVISVAAGGTDPRIVGRAYARAWHYFYTEALGISKPEGAMSGPLSEFYDTDTVWNDTLRGVGLRDAEVSMAARNAQVAKVVDQKTAEAAYQSAMKGDLKLLEAIMAKLARVEDIGLAWFQLSDNAWKDAAFEAALAGELKDPSLRDAGGKISADTLIQMENRAAEWVKSRFPTMERVTGVTNILKKAKLAPFVSFLDQAYMITVMNPINDIKTLNEKGLLMEGWDLGMLGAQVGDFGASASEHQKKMYKARAIRGLIGSTTVMACIPAMAMMISKAFGVDDEEEEEYRAMLAPFERDSMSLAMFKGPDGVIRHVNLDFMNFMSAPLSSFRAAQMAYGRTKKVGSPEEAATDAFFAWLSTITEPARTFNVGIGATVEAVTNMKESGGEIVNPEATRGEHLTKRTWHAASSFLIPNSIRKVMPGKGFVSGTDSYGNPVSMLEVITQMALPLRAEVDYEKAGTAKIYEAKRAMENADRYFRSSISRMPTEEGTKMSKAQADKVFLRESAQLSLVMNGLRRRGKTEEEISSMLGTSGVKSYAVDAIINGMASGYQVSQSTLDKAFEKSGVDATPWIPDAIENIDLE